ncbi:MAG: IS1634 family transposase [Oscillospiraceae bacterium]|nr:IS1634 family transposase [Oscillospiraceae bacterium]
MLSRHYKQILSIAYYLILEDKNPLSRFRKWSKLHTHPFGKEIPSQQSTDIFANITEEQRLNFFRLQCSRRAEKEYIAYDTTSISSYSKSLKQVRHGKNKDHDKLQQINLAVLYGEESCLPFYYKKLAGNISDVSTIKQLVSDMDFLGCDGNKKLVLDRGFCSEKNINDLYTEKLKFLMGTKLSLKYVVAELARHRETVRDWRNLLLDSDTFGFSVPIKWHHKRNPKGKIGKNKWMYLHLYYDSIRTLDDERALSKLLSQLNYELKSGNLVKTNETLYEQYFTVKSTPVRGTKVTLKEDVVANERKNFGYFALIGNEKLSAERALDIYRNKDVAEKAFDNVKDRLDMRSLNVSSELSLDGKLFVAFVALICVSHLHNAMKRARLYSKFTMDELIDELELVERFEC